MAKPLLPILLLISIVSFAWAKDESIEARNATLIRQVKQTAVYELDHELPVVSFERWLSAEADADAEFHWEVNDCGARTGTSADRGRNVSTCVEAHALMKDKRTIIVSLAVETYKKGLIGKPSVHFAQLVTPSETIDIHRLSDLPAALIKTHREAPHVEIVRSNLPNHGVSSESTSGPDSSQIRC